MATQTASTPCVEQLADGVGPGEVGEVGDPARRPAAGSARPRLPVRLATAASSTSTRPKSRRYKPVGVELLEERPVGVVEDHAQADHAGPQAVLGEVRWRVMRIGYARSGVRGQAMNTEARTIARHGLHPGRCRWS